MSEKEAGPEPAGIKFGPVWMVPGVSRLNARVLVFAAYLTIALLVYQTIGVPYLLDSTLKVPVAEQGRITGDLQFLAELVMLVVFAPAGILADRIGRRQVYAMGLGLMGVAYFLFPLAETVFQLAVLRGTLAAGVGFATGMMGTIIADYPQERSRGKMVAMIGVLNGAGVVSIALTLGRLPDVLTEMLGVTPAVAGMYTHWVVAAFCFIVALAVAWGLQKGTPVRREDRPPVRELALSGLKEARNPRLALAYASAFVARSDLVVLGTFLVLWGQVAGVAQGLNTAEASSQASRLFGVASGAGLLWLPVLGWFLDKLNRVTGVAICMSLTATAYGFMIFVDNPIDPRNTLWFVYLGMGQVSAFLGATILIGQEAPADKRGAVIGMFNMVGAAGILFSVGVGGRMFDAIAPWTVFALVSVMASLVMVFAIVVRLKSPGPMPKAGGVLSSAPPL